MPAAFFDTAVKLAGLGAAGVCVFALLCCVWLLSRPRGNDKPQSQSLIKWFMGLCVLMAVVTLLSAIFSAKAEAEKVPSLKAEIERLENENREQAAVIQKLQRNLDRRVQNAQDYRDKYNHGLTAARTAVELGVSSKYKAPLLAFLDALKPHDVEEEK